MTDIRTPLLIAQQIPQAKSGHGKKLLIALWFFHMKTASAKG